MEWNNYCVTNAGVDVLKKAIGGQKVTITAAKSGTGIVAENKLKEQSSLSGTVRSITIANATNQPEGYRVTLRVTNTGVKSSYIFKQLGLFATAEDESEVLFAILQSENGETVPDESELYTYDVSLIIAISDTSNITVNVDKTSYVTEEELDGHKTNKTNPHNVTKAQVGLGNVPNVSTNDQTPTYAVPTSNAELVSGEKLETAFGKIASAIKSLISHLASKSNPHGVTKTQVGLGNVENTSDADKPVSTATSKAISSAVAKKADLEHKHTAAEVGAATKNDIMAAIDDIQVGTRNLVTGTADMTVGSLNQATRANGQWRASGTGTIETIDITDGPIAIGKGIKVKSTQAQKQIGIVQDKVPLNNSNIYTLSCWVRGSTATGLKCKLQPFYQSSSDNGGVCEIDITDQWQYVSYTTVRNPQNTAEYSAAYIYLVSTAIGDTMEICGVKLEVGNKVTDWAPAPEDVKAEISNRYPAQAKSVLGLDYNDLISNGIFELQGTADNPTKNAPDGNNSNNNYYVQVFARSSTYLTQIATSVRSDKTQYIRSMANGSWNDWAKIKAGDADTVSGHTVGIDVPANAKFTDTLYTPFVKSGAGAKAGLVPTPSTTAGTSKYLCENGTWAVPPDTKYSAATTTSAGLLSASDKSKLDGIEAGADKYKLPVASETLGGVKTGPTIVVNSDGTMSIVKDSHYHSALEAIDITGKTVDLDTLDLSDAPGQIKHFVEKTTGGAANITNLPKTGMFLLTVRNIRWVSSTDFITEQLFLSVTTKKEYSRWCTSGTWSAWIEHNYTNTWRGIQDNLTSESTTDSLSAAQGKALKALVDSKASSGHTHSYAGSSSVGGAATSANKINTDAGSATQPVYFKDGIPKATTYTLGKSVPSNAVFTDTWKAMGASSSNAAGTAGYVPAPAKGTSNRYLRCDGTWSVPSGSISVKQGTALNTAIDISSRGKAYIEFYKTSSETSGAAKSFNLPLIIEDTTPTTAVSHKTVYTASDIAILYSLTTDGKITFEGSGNYKYVILLFN